MTMSKAAVIYPDRSDVNTYRTFLRFLFLNARNDVVNDAAAITAIPPNGTPLVPGLDISPSSEPSGSMPIDPSLFSGSSGVSVSSGSFVSMVSGASVSVVSIISMVSIVSAVSPRSVVSITVR